MGMNTAVLTKEELARWRNFRFMVEETSIKVSREVSSATGISGGQFGIMSIVTASPAKEMRQQELADAMRWDRTRLSHQLTRMEKNGLIERKKSPDGGTVITVTPKGSTELIRISPTLANAVRTHFLSKLTETHMAQLSEILAALRAGEQATPSESTADGS